MPKARMMGSGMRSRGPPMSKFWRDLWVCAPHNLTVHTQNKRVRLINKSERERMWSKQKRGNGLVGGNLNGSKGVSFFPKRRGIGSWSSKTQGEGEVGSGCRWWTAWQDVQRHGWGLNHSLERATTRERILSVWSNQIRYDTGGQMVPALARFPTGIMGTAAQ